MIGEQFIEQVPEVNTVSGNQEVDQRLEVEPVLSADEKLRIVESSPAIYHFTSLFSLELILKNGIFSQKLAARVKHNLVGGWGPSTQRASGRLDVVSVTNSSNTKKFNNDCGISALDPFYTEDEKVFILLNPLIKSEPAPKTGTTMSGEEFVSKRVKPDDIYCIAINQKLAERDISDIIYNEVYRDRHLLSDLLTQLSKDKSIAEEDKTTINQINDKLQDPEYYVSYYNPEPWSDRSYLVYVFLTHEEKVFLKKIITSHLEKIDSQLNKWEDKKVIDYLHLLADRYGLKVVVLPSKKHS